MTTLRAREAKTTRTASTPAARTTKEEQKTIKREMDMTTAGTARAITTMTAAMEATPRRPQARKPTSTISPRAKTSTLISTSSKRTPPRRTMNLSTSSNRSQTVLKRPRTLLHTLKRITPKSHLNKPTIPKSPKKLYTNRTARKLASLRNSQDILLCLAMVLRVQRRRGTSKMMDLTTTKSTLPF